MLNKKGFINLGIILLILSSALAMLSFTSVKGSMTSARDKAFVTTAEIHLKAAEIWYTSESVKSGINGNACVTFDTLYNNKYLENNDYDGYIEFIKDNDSIESYIYISSEDFGIYSKTQSDLISLGEDVIESPIILEIPKECK